MVLCVLRAHIHFAAQYGSGLFVEHEKNVVKNRRQRLRNEGIPKENRIRDRIELRYDHCTRSDVTKPFSPVVLTEPWELICKQNLCWSIRNRKTYVKVCSYQNSKRLRPSFCYLPVHLIGRRNIYRSYTSSEWTVGQLLGVLGRNEREIAASHVARLCFRIYGNVPYVTSFANAIHSIEFPISRLRAFYRKMLISFSFYDGKWKGKRVWSYQRAKIGWRPEIRWKEETSIEMCKKQATM